MKIKLIIALIPCVISGSNLFGSTLINLIGGYYDNTPVLISGPGVLGEAGDFWNTFNTGTHDPMLNILDSKNNATSISFSAPSPNGGGGVISATTGFFSPDQTGYYSTFNTNLASYSITGLTDYIGVSFELIVYSMIGNNAANVTSTFELSDGSSSAMVLGKDSSSDIPLQEGLSYGILRGVVDNTGEINFTQTAQTGSFVYFNGFQLAIPEPSSYATVLGIISTGFIALRRRRK